MGQISAPGERPISAQRDSKNEGPNGVPRVVRPLALSVALILAQTFAPYRGSCRRIYSVTGR
ncbi:MAG: hypothetical protein ACYTG5_17845 [Planctomycetota bacterium]